MLTWQEVRRHIRASYSPIQDNDASLVLHCEFDEGVLNVVVARGLQVEGAGEEIEITARVNDAGCIPVGDARAYNDGAPCGGLVLRGEAYVLRLVLALDDATTEALDEALRYVAGEAMRLRLRTAPIARVGPELFSYLAS
jgi:hypothetical protein